MTKEKIEEIIVVEGKDDTKRLKEVFDVDTIETRGSAINESILEQIEHAQETRGVIVFTDPDFSGRRFARRSWRRFLMPSMLFYQDEWRHRKNVAAA